MNYGKIIVNRRKEIEKRINAIKEEIQQQKNKIKNEIKKYIVEPNDYDDYNILCVLDNIETYTKYIQSYKNEIKRLKKIKLELNNLIYSDEDIESLLIEIANFLEAVDINEFNDIYNNRNECYDEISDKLFNSTMIVIDTINSYDNLDDELNNKRVDLINKIKELFM